MLQKAALLALPLLAFGQAFGQAPSPEADQALRERVSEFFQDHVDGKFIKAFDLVAEDTKEYFFSAQKSKLLSFKIDTIEYSENSTKADVRLTTERMVKM